jgi:hypothetical protein
MIEPPLIFVSLQPWPTRFLPRFNRAAVANAHPGHDTHTLGVELKSATPVVEFFPNE